MVLTITEILKTIEELLLREKPEVVAEIASELLGNEVIYVCAGLFKIMDNQKVK